MTTAGGRCGHSLAVGSASEWPPLGAVALGRGGALWGQYNVFPKSLRYAPSFCPEANESVGIVVVL